MWVTPLCPPWSADFYSPVPHRLPSVGSLIVIFYALHSFSSFIAVYGPVTAAAPALLPSHSQAGPLLPWPHPVTFVIRRRPQHFASLLETPPLWALKAIKPCKKPVGFSLHTHWLQDPPPAPHRAAAGPRAWGVSYRGRPPPVPQPLRHRRPSSGGLSRAQV